MVCGEWGPIIREERRTFGVVIVDRSGKTCPSLALTFPVLPNSAGGCL